MRAAILFLALLTVVAQALVAAAAVLAVGGRWSPALARAGAAARHALAPQALALAWLVALAATAGSLFLSEVAGLPPCRLCWYQRIAMYPLVVVLGVAAWRGDRGVRAYVLPLAGLGLALSGYHYVLERFPALEGRVCDPRLPCSATLVWELGYVSIPMMAASAFALVAVLVAVGHEEAER